MLVVLQALAFTGCVLIGLLPNTEVDCHFSAPLVTWSAPPPAYTLGPAVCAAPAPPPVVTPADQ